MPFTTYHLASGLLLGYILRRKLNWLTLLIVTAFIADIEPIYIILTHGGNPHGLSHTITASIILGPLTGLILYFFRESIHRLSITFYLYDTESIESYIFGGLTGWLLHVALDAPFYYEMNPLWPLHGNPFYIRDVDFIIGPIYDAILLTGFTSYALYLYNNLKPYQAGMIASSLALLGLFFISKLSCSSMVCLAIVFITIIAVLLLCRGLNMINPEKQRLVIASGIILVTSLLLYIFNNIPLYCQRDFKYMMTSIALNPAIFLTANILLTISIALMIPIIISIDKSMKPWMFTLLTGAASITMEILGIGLILVLISYLKLFTKLPRVIRQIHENYHQCGTSQYS